MVFQYTITMPRIRTLRAKPPPEVIYKMFLLIFFLSFFKGFDDIEPILHDFAQKMKDSIFKKAFSI